MHLGFVALLLLLCCVAAAAKDPSPSPSAFPEIPPDGRSEIVLVSWKAGTSFVYVLLPRQKFDEFTERIFEPLTPKLSKRHVILTMSELEAEIGRIPKSSLVTWRDFPPEAVRVGYPPRDILDHVKAFAAAHGVDLQLNPTTYNP